MRMSRNATSPFLRLALALPRPRLRLAIRLIESLEVVPDSGKPTEREA